MTSSPSPASASDDSTTLTTRTQVLHLAEGDSPTDADAAPTLVTGVVLGPGDRTVGETGVEVLWPGETLAAAVDAGVFDAIPLVEDHPDPDAPQPPARAVVGEVTDVSYDPALGVVFRGELDDAALAAKVDRGRLDVSAVLAARVEAVDGEQVAQEILGVRDLGLVARGAAPSNHVTTALAAPVEQATLAAVFDAPVESVDTAKVETAADATTASGTDDAGDTPVETPDETTETTPTDRVARLEADLAAVRAENREMRAVFATALAAVTPFDADTVAERFDFAEMRTALADAGRDATDALALTPAPRTGSDAPATTVRTETLADTGPPDEARLDADTREQVLALQRRIDVLARHAPAHVTRLKTEAASLAGVDDYAAIDFDAL